MTHTLLPVVSLALATVALAQRPLADGVLLAGSMDQPRAISSADIDGDGTIDLVLTGGGGLTYWQRGLGLGEFDSAEVLIESVAPASSLTAFDLDADGDVEILRGGELWTPVSGGGYGLVSSVPLVVGEYEILDLDGDGLVDIFVSPQFWHRGLGGLSFAPPERVIDGTTSVRRIAFADFDGDGNLDLVMAQSSSQLPRVAVYPGTGSMPFTSSGAIPIATNGFTSFTTNNIVALDGDLDGDLDIALGSLQGSSSFAYVENLGTLSFAQDVPIGSVTSTEFVRTADYDGDGRTDLIAQTFDSGEGHRLVAFRGLGDGTFSPTSISDSVAMSFDLLAQDLSGDGADEIVLIHGPAQVELFDLDAGGSFSSQPLNETLTVVAAVDVDQDARLDLVATAENPKRVVWKRRGTDGSYGRAREIVAQPPGSSTSGFGVAAGDMDGDGLTDLVMFNVSSLFEADVSLLRALPGGGFSAPTVIADVPILTLFGLQRILAVDADQDQDLDVFLISPSGEVILISNLGGASFGMPVLGSPSQSNVAGPEVADVDGDGVPDIVHPFTSELFWRRGLGDGTFAPRESLIGLGLRSIAFADRNGDGNPDLVGTTSPDLGGSIIAASSIGPGQFTGSSTVAQNATALSVTLADLSLSGRPEVIATKSTPDLLTIWSGIAFGGPLGNDVTPELPSRWSATRIGSALPLDIDDDGDIDLVLNPQLALGRSHAVAILENVTFDELGAAYCGPGVVNSTGVAGETAAYGTASVPANQVELQARSLPPGSTTFFIASQTTGFQAGLPSSVGNLCLSGEIGRFVGPGQIGNADSSGEFTLELDLGAFPSPSLGLIPVQIGQTWNFQAWHRDTVQGQATSNFTPGLSVTFL